MIEKYSPPKKERTKERTLEDKDVDLALLYRLILETYMIFIRKNHLLRLSICCPDTSKRVLQIVTVTKIE